MARLGYSTGPRSRSRSSSPARAAGPFHCCVVEWTCPGRKDGGFASTHHAVTPGKSWDGMAEMGMMTGRCARSIGAALRSIAVSAFWLLLLFFGPPLCWRDQSNTIPPINTHTFDTRHSNAHPSQKLPARMATPEELQRCVFPYLHRSELLACLLRVRSHRT